MNNILGNRIEAILTDYVHSQNDGGWYAEQTDFTRKIEAMGSSYYPTRVTRRVYPSRAACVDAVWNQVNIWEKWR